MKKEVLFVLTTANAYQSKLANRLLEAMNLPYSVVTLCDNESGSSIGSGGALLHALDTYYEQYQKIVIINSGGYSKRIINYALSGKIFAHIKENGNETTLLESIADNAYRLSRQFEKGVLVCCSDILVHTERLQLSMRENTGFCVYADLQTASRHGVMFADESGYLAHYLHKQPISRLEQQSNGAQEVLIDTGMVYLNHRCAQALFALNRENALVQYLRESAEQICLYDDIVCLFSDDVDKNTYLAKENAGKKREIKKRLFDVLHTQRMQVCIVGENFIHFGTIVETLHHIRLLDGVEKPHLLHSFCESGCAVADSAVLDNVALSGKSRVGKNCLVTNIALRDVVIPDDTAVCGIKLRDGSFVSVITSVFENAKERVNGVEIWSIPRFYKGVSFESSLSAFFAQSDGEKVSIRDCIEQADYTFYPILASFIQTQSEQQRSALYLEYRSEILREHFATLPRFDFSHFFTKQAHLDLPLRVNLAGTWTDAMPYCIDRGGEMLNMAVYCDNKLSVHISAKSLESSAIVFTTAGKTETYQAQMQSELSAFHIFYAVLKTLGLEKAEQCESGFEIAVHIDGIDGGSGLGVSSIIMAGCFMVLNRLFGLGLHREEIVQLVFVAEQVMGTGGGWQDQIGALYPGIKYSASAPGIKQDIQVTQLALQEKIAALIGERSVLIPTGIEHFGKSIVGDVMHRYLSGNEECLQALEAMRMLNHTLMQAIAEDDTEAFCDGINHHAALLCRISQSTFTTKTVEIAELLKPYVKALSICGAGGGGYYFAVLNDTTNITAFRKIYKKLVPSAGSEVKKVSIFQKDIFSDADCEEEHH